MDAKLFSGTSKCQKRYCFRQLTCLDYVKLHGVHGNTSGTVAGSFASRPMINTSSRQCYSVLSDILVKNELCIPLER